jgi:mannose-6-phosphate isomerase-like protein (cupin superfamily)
MSIRPARRVDKPWGWELIWAESERYAGKTLHIEAGEALSLQYHERKDETIHLLSGVLDLDIQEESGVLKRVRLRPGESVRIRPHTRHRLVAIETCDVLEVSTPELDDVVRLEDRYGRAGK